MDAVTVAINTVAYSESFEFGKCSGDASVLVSSTAGSVTVVQEVSFDNYTWYAPVDDSAAVIGDIVTTMTVNAGRWVGYSPVLAPYARYKVTETNVAETIVSITVSFQEDQ